MVLTKIYIAKRKKIKSGRNSGKRKIGLESSKGNMEVGEVQGICTDLPQNFLVTEQRVAAGLFSSSL